MRRRHVQNHAMSRRPRFGRRPLRGFTLIELMIAVAIAAILGAVVFPSFMDSMRKSRRTEAFSAISAVQQAQERHRSNSASYADSLGGLGIGSSTTTPGGYYTLAVSVDEATEGTEYIVSAAAVTGKSQANDGDCARLAARVQGAVITYASCATCSTFTFTESNACWKR
jgi:type IV pilus assembly protein PilE